MYLLLFGDILMFTRLLASSHQPFLRFSTLDGNDRLLIEDNRKTHFPIVVTAESATNEIDLIISLCAKTSSSTSVIR